jgi:hypothetical protein
MSDYKPVEKLNYSFYKWIHTSKDLTDLCYVGSTANLASRKRNHKNCCNNPNMKAYDTLLYATMRENGGFENFKMVILGTAEQITKREAEAIEEEYRIKEQATLNMKRCFITAEQYRQDNKQHKAEYDKQYRQDNAEIRKIEHRLDYLENKEIITIQRRIRYLKDKK